MGRGLEGVLLAPEKTLYPLHLAGTPEGLRWEGNMLEEPGGRQERRQNTTGDSLRCFSLGPNGTLIFNWNLKSNHV